MLEDIAELEKSGIDVQWNGQIVNLKGTISYFPADNLAANEVGGFVQSFQGDLCKLLKFIYLDKS
jgi:hypothetical protein